MKVVTRMMLPMSGCNPTAMDVEVVEPGGLSEPTTVVVLEVGLLEFSTVGEISELQMVYRVIPF
ncbi:hypothetical protein HS088_TW12G01140 [Tripterygium wilfordii]|uniref:Uncharacterized protein n=1 Tax=Tripterygium wilfordii TaxID=458696 RepID=A0A7J7D1H7_TRIWF|nr:hypothetical protein HS088_TW12G01140 [Tripterygium wilfordii]